MKYVNVMAFQWIKRWWITARNESAEPSNIRNEYASEYIPPEQIRDPERIHFYTGAKREGYKNKVEFIVLVDPFLLSGSGGDYLARPVIFMQLTNVILCPT